MTPSDKIAAKLGLKDPEITTAFSENTEPENPRRSFFKSPH